MKIQWYAEFEDNFGNYRSNHGGEDLNLSCPDGGGVAACVVVLLHRDELCLCLLENIGEPAFPSQLSRNGSP